MHITAPAAKVSHVNRRSFAGVAGGAPGDRSKAMTDTREDAGQNRKGASISPRDLAED
jgi:hypothetical protein